MQSPTHKENYRYVRKIAQDSYYRLGRIPGRKFNGEDVVFNNIGFRHLMWKGKKRRPKEEQITRFALIPHAVSIINDPTAIVIRRRTIARQTIKWHGKKKTVISRAHFWAFTAHRDGKTITVIVRQVRKGEKHFFSIFENK